MSTPTCLDVFVLLDARSGRFFGRRAGERIHAFVEASDDVSIFSDREQIEEVIDRFPVSLLAGRDLQIWSARIEVEASEAEPVMVKGGVS